MTEKEFTDLKWEASEAKLNYSKAASALNKALLIDAEEQQQRAKDNFSMGLITHKEYFEQVRDIFETAEKRVEDYIL